MAAVDQWFVVLNAMVAGDPEPFAALFSHADDVLYMSGEGTFRVGWEATWADWQEQAKKSLGGHVKGDDIHIIVTAISRPSAWSRTPPSRRRTARPRNSASGRRTSSVRRDGVWKMIVHHADNIPVWNTIVDGK